MESNSGFTLTQMAYFGRNTIKYGGILLVVLIVGRVLVGALLDYWVATHPPAPPPPSVGFGILPSLRFPERTDEDKPTSYQLETATGTLPEFGDRAKVFMMEKSTPSLLADQRVKQIAATYGFLFQPTVLNARTYRWTKSAPLQSTLEMDTQTNTFTFETNYLSKPELIAQKNLPPEEDVVGIVKSYIATGQELPEDLATSSGRITYLKAVGREVAPAVSYSDADFLQVDLMRAAVDDAWPMYTPEGKKGIAHGIIASGLENRDQIVHFEYYYHPVDYIEYHTYPIRTVRQAWQLLQAGEGFTAVKGQFDTAVIRDVYLGYYDDFEEQEYLQPIYVFEGDGGFLGYVPAIDSRFIQQGP